LNKGENDYYPTDDFFIMGEEDIYARLQYLDRWIVDAAIMNTALIAQECNVEIKVEGNHFPVFPVDDKLKTIKDICRDGWKQKIVPYIPKDKLKEYQERLLHELDVLEKCDYLNYLLITWDILDWCKRNDILTGIGRGSCGGSLVCYLMDITKLDPIEHDLLFSRFVNIERVTSADIDNDIEDTRRGDVINYIREKYGEVYNIRTFNFLGVKGSIQRACQALKIAPRISIELSKNTESLDDIQGYEEMVDIARHFKDLLHAFGCHASAVMIFPDSPSNYTPIEKQKDTFLAAYDYHDLEAMSLVKMDILGLRNLTIIHDTLRMIDEPLDIYRLPLDDAEVYEQYAEGHTMGIFQAESSLMRQYAKQMKVDKFEDIAALISLVRPGPLDSGMAQQYIDGKNGGEIRVLHPVLEDILGVSFQVLVYQEQLLSIAQKMGGMSLGESDVLRKVVARKELDKDEHGLTPVDYAVKNFIEKSVANGISQEVAVEIGRQITACGRYIFNKSHGFLYAYTSYITAYMKKKFTIQYMCCLLNSVIGDLEKTPEYIKECQRLDITIVPPNLQLSKEKFTISDNSILYGLTAIKGIGKNLSTLKTATFADVIQCNSKGVTEALIKSGALSYLGHSRALLLVNLNPLQDILKRQSQCNIQIVENQQKLSASTTEKDHKKYSRQLQSWREKLSQCEHQESQQVTGEYDEIAGECEVLGFSFQSIPKIKSGLLVKIFEKKDKNGNLMSFLNLETKYGDFRATCFTTGWLKIKSNVKQGETYDFVVSDTGILTEIRISGSVIKTNERKRYN
jgi:DNA polymerase-3 subunit alpha